MPWRQSLVPFAAAAAFGLALLAFIGGHDLEIGVFRVYGTTTDVMPHKETLFFVALAVLGTGATWFGTIGLVRLAGDRLRAAGRYLQARPRATVAGLALLAFLLAAVVSWLSLQHATVVLDEDLYRFQVDLLRKLQLYTTPPRPLTPFREFYSVQTRGVWSGIYPWGHIAAILPGYVLGFPQLVPHLCAAAAVVLTYHLGKELFPDDNTTPLVGAGVVALSPFVAFTCATTHNSTTSLVLVNLGLWALVRAVRRDATLFALLSGLAFGVGLHSRPLNSVAVAMPAAIIALLAAIRLRRRWIRLALVFVIGVLPGIAVYFLLNWIITKNPWMTPATMSHPTRLQIFGFDNTLIEHTPLLAFGKAGTNLLRFVLWTSGSLLAALSLTAFTGGLRRRTTDLVLLLPIVSVFGCYYFYFTSPGSDTGPLYYLDIVPSLALIVGRTVAAIPDRFPGETSDRLTRAGLVMSAVVGFATFWPLQWIAGWNVTTNNLMPYRAVEKAGIHQAVVFYNRNPKFRSWKLTPIPPKPDLSDDILYARYEETTAPLLWDRFKDKRKFYILVFTDDGPVVEPWIPGSGGLNAR